jgi:hypothetical protein
MSETNNNNDIFDADFASGVAAYDAKNFSMAYQLLAPLANNNNPEALWRIAIFIHSSALVASFNISL